MVPFTDEARWLMQAGALTLSRMSAVGLPIDVGYCTATRKKLHAEMTDIENSVWTISGGKEWKKTYGHTATITNDDQLRFVLFQVLKLDRPENPEGGESDSVDRDFLEDVDHPLAERILSYRKRAKVANTVLSGFLKEQVDGLVHPSMLLNLVRSYRTSSSEPNGQNIPLRDPEMGPLCRKAVRAPKGHRIVSSDWSQLEVRIGACYHKDPVKLQYIEDDYDIHRDMAMECFILTEEEYNGCPMKKMVRHAGKNGFVFPSDYGSWWPKLSVGLWKQMTRGGFKLADGTLFAQHLANHGFDGLGKPKLDERGRIIDAELGTYMAHIKKVEKKYWGQRFAVYDQWRKDWYKQYQRLGYFDSLTGFHYEGSFRKNEVINYPVQGSASHCKVLACILLERALWDRKMSSRMFLEIHDDILGLVPDAELDDYAALTIDCQTRQVRERWDWIITPMQAEVEVTPSGGNWHEKKTYTPTGS